MSSAPGNGLRAVTYTAQARVGVHRRPPVWQQEICREVRELRSRRRSGGRRDDQFRDARPTSSSRNICALLAAKDHVNVFLYDGGIVPDPEGIVTGGHDNTTARTVAIREGRDLAGGQRCSGRSSRTTEPAAGGS